MKMNLRLTKIITYQNLGFLGVITLCFLDDIVKFPALAAFDLSAGSTFRPSTLEVVLIMAVWLFVSSSTRRILERISYLEKFMRVCSWCRRINHHGEWMRLEEFMKQGFDTPTTHGICQECLAQQQAQIQRFKQLKTMESIQVEASQIAQVGERTSPSERRVDE